ARPPGYHDTVDDERGAHRSAAFAWLRGRWGPDRGHAHVALAADPRARPWAVGVARRRPRAQRVPSLPWYTPSWKSSEGPGGPTSRLFRSPESPHRTRLVGDDSGGEDRSGLGADAVVTEERRLGDAPGRWLPRTKYEYPLRAVHLPSNLQVPRWNRGGRARPSF